MRVTVFKSTFENPITCSSSSSEIHIAERLKSHHGSNELKPVCYIFKLLHHLCERQAVEACSAERSRSCRAILHERSGTAAFATASVTTAHSVYAVSTTILSSIGVCAIASYINILYIYISLYTQTFVQVCQML
jgi:hypothetical protein